jgi:outer membrane protein assembly factor BamB
MRRILLVVCVTVVFGFSSVMGYAQLANSPWPMFQHDLRHTGQSQYAGPSVPVLAWSYATGFWVSSSSPALGGDGKAYFGSQDYRFYSLNSNGALNWSYLTAGWVMSSPALGSDGRIYVGSWYSTDPSNNYLYAFNLNGSLDWSYAIFLGVLSSPALGSDGKVYVGSDGNYLFSFNWSGSLSWSYRTGSTIAFSSPALGSDGKVYVGSDGNYLFSFNLNGSLDWSYVTGGNVRRSPALGSDGKVYIGSEDNNLYSFNLNGSLDWSYVTGDAVSSSPALGNDGRVYVGSADNNIYSFKPDGTLAWTYLTCDQVSSPSLGNDGKVYVGSRDNNLYVLNSNGIFKWSYATRLYVYSSPALGSDGRVYVGSCDNSLYVFMPNYVELNVAGGGDFNPRDPVVLHWETHEVWYNFANVPCLVYLGAALDPPVEDTVLTVQQIVQSRALYLFDSKMRAVKYNPKNVKPTFRGVPFPVPKLGSSGSLTFTAPRGAAGRWVFVTAFIRMDNGKFPAEPPVEVSNGFTLH